MKRLALALTLLLAPAFAAGADLPGRLFFTPQQRAALDQARQHKTPTSPAKPPAFSGRVTFDGFVRSSDGRSTVWINDKALSGKDLPPGYAVAADAPGVLKLPMQKKRVQLKPGQSLDPDTGRVVEQYQNPPAPVVPAAPAPATARPGGGDPAADQTAAP
jgi:hypothetical protein